MSELDPGYMTDGGNILPQDIIRDEVEQAENGNFDPGDESVKPEESET